MTVATTTKGKRKQNKSKNICVCTTYNRNEFLCVIFLIIEKNIFKKKNASSKKNLLFDDLKCLIKIIISVYKIILSIIDDEKSNPSSIPDLNPIKKELGVVDTDIKKLYGK